MIIHLSAKDAGRVAAAWAQYQTQEKLAAAAEAAQTIGTLGYTL